MFSWPNEIKKLHTFSAQYNPWIQSKYQDHVFKKTRLRVKSKTAGKLFQNKIKSM